MLPPILNSGAYSIRLLVVQNENRVVFELDSAATFIVADTARRDGASTGRDPGVIQPRLPWSERIVDASA